MCFDAKSSITSWVLITIVALLLWYRNIEYDRALAGFIFVVGLIQLIEYGYYSSLDPHQAGKLIYLVLWLQVCVLSIGVYFYLKTTPALISAIIFTLIFFIALIASINKSFDVVETPQHIEWKQGDGGILGASGWIYLVGLALPFVLLLSTNQGWTNWGLWLLLAYGLISALIVWKIYGADNFASMWCYFAIIFAFLAWLANAFVQP